MKSAAEGPAKALSLFVVVLKLGGAIPEAWPGLNNGITGELERTRDDEGVVSKDEQAIPLDDRPDRSVFEEDGGVSLSSIKDDRAAALDAGFIRLNCSGVLVLGADGSGGSSFAILLDALALVDLGVLSRRFVDVSIDRRLLGASGRILAI